MTEQPSSEHSGVDEFVRRFDHHSPDYPRLADAIMQYLHANAPVLHTSAWGGYYVVAKMAHIKEAVSRPDVFSSSRSINIPESKPSLENLLDMDPPRNIAYRALFAPLMTRRAIETRRGAIRALAFDLVQEKLACGRLDVVRDIAQPVAGITTFQLVGLDVANWRMYAEPMHDFFYGIGPMEEAFKRILALGEPLAEELERISRAPVPGTVLEKLFSGSIEGRRLTLAEIGGITMNIIGGGLDTAQALTGNAIVHLGRNAQQRAQLIAQPEKIPAAVEELLRMYAPFQGSARYLLKDYMLGGTQLRAGDWVYLHWAAASRDPDHYRCPYAVDFDREPAGHAAFGLGAHICPGAHLARVEIQSNIEALLTGMPQFELLESELRLARDMGVVFGYDSVPIAF